MNTVLGLSVSSLETCVANPCIGLKSISCCQTSVWRNLLIQNNVTSDKTVFKLSVLVLITLLIISEISLFKSFLKNA